jgi:glycosyltransferase involved in cell wall biosynthesis
MGNCVVTPKTSILIVLKDLGPGGAQNLVLESIKHHDSEEFTITLVVQWIADAKMKSEIERHNVSVMSLGEVGVNTLLAAFRLANLIRVLRPNIIHIHSPLLGSFARLSRLLFSRPTRVVSTEHNLWSRYRPATRFLNSITSQIDHAVVAVSNEVKASQCGPVKKKCETVIHGVDVREIQSQYNFDASTIPDRRSQDHDFHFLTVGRLHRQKDYPNFLRAVALVRASGYLFVCSIVGEGGELQELKLLADQLGVSDIVNFLGFRDDVLDLMVTADALVISSAWEGTPLVLMEALAVGLPIISTAVGGIREQLSDSDACLLCEPGDPRLLAEGIKRFIQDPALRYQMRMATRVASELFDSRRTVARVETLYKSLMCPT